ncbi:MAG TPA: tyrosine-type recombinase/integrase [Pyrinomonadaceae bacterium]|jgi:integrase
MKMMLNFFMKSDVLTKANPVSRVKFLAENNEQMRVLTPGEEKLYPLAASQPLQDIAALMLETGLRPEEVCRIRRENVHLEHNHLCNPYGKTKAAKRKVPLSEKAAAVLAGRLVDVKGELSISRTRWRLLESTMRTRRRSPAQACALSECMICATPGRHAQRWLALTLCG